MQESRQEKSKIIFIGEENEINSKILVFHPALDPCRIDFFNERLIKYD
jgi:hypothetical protein